MVFNPRMRRRRSVRLHGFDYGTAGAYFITICADERDFLFGDVVDGKMVVNDFGVVVGDEWRRTEYLRSNVVLDEFIIMPNHFHGILFIKDVGAHCMRPDTVNHSNPNRAHVGAQTRAHVGAQTRAHVGAPLRRESGTVGSIIAGFKSAVTKRINILRNTPGFKVWQRNYYERVIRTDVELTDTREYIVNNPVCWHDDEHYRGQ